MTRMMSVITAVVCLTVFPQLARADTATSCFVNDANGSLIGDVGQASCAVTLASNAFAQALITPAGGTIGAQVANPFSNKESGAQAGHFDTWYCLTPQGTACGSIPPTIPVSIRLKAEGSVTSANDTFIVEARYTTSSGQLFVFHVEGADGVGAYGRYFPNFVVSPSTFIDVPVTLTTDSAGVVHFSIDFTPTTPTLWSPSIANDPTLIAQTDTQSLETLLWSDGTDQKLDAFHTFGVTVTSLDPDIVLVSADGRYARPAAGANQPSAIQPPINADGSSTFKLGQTIPVKIKVTDPNGSPVDGLAPQLALVMITPSTGVVNELFTSGNADSGTILRSLGNGDYIFNLSTKRSQFNAGQDLAVGRYRLTISEPSFTAPVIVEFGLR